jgi:hypothetical protein
MSKTNEELKTIFVTSMNNYINYISNHLESVKLALNNINLNDDIDIWYKLYLDIDKQILNGFHIPLNVLEEDIKFAAELLNNTIPNNPVEQTIQNNKVEQILRLGTN